LQPKVEKLHRIEVGFRTDRQGRQQMLAQEALMLTGDMNILAIEFIVQYKIKESANYLFSVAEIHETIGKAAEASMREVVGKSKIDEALTTGKAQIQQELVLLQSILDQYHGGVQVTLSNFKMSISRGRGGCVQGCDKCEGRSRETDQPVSELSQRHSPKGPRRSRSGGEPGQG
jgi:hypothetical protein